MSQDTIASTSDMSTEEWSGLNHSKRLSFRLSQVWMLAIQELIYG